MNRLYLAAMIACSLVQPALGQDIAGVPYILDGDTISLEGKRIRLLGIDAPEAAQTCQRAGTSWMCGDDAESTLGAITGGKRVTCQPVELDVYGRTVARCYVGTVDIAAEMVRSGLAIVLGNAPVEYRSVEAQSRAYRVGLWGSEFQTPAEYRQAHSPRHRNNAAEWAPVRSVQQSAPRTPGMFYSCAAARAAGAAPMYRGQAGYNPNLDGDNDGIACEPYPRKR